MADLGVKGGKCSWAPPRRGGTMPSTLPGCYSEWLHATPSGSSPSKVSEELDTTWNGTKLLQGGVVHSSKQCAPTPRITAVATSPFFKGEKKDGGSSAPHQCQSNCCDAMRSLQLLLEWGSQLGVGPRVAKPPALLLKGMIGGWIWGLGF